MKTAIEVAKSLAFYLSITTDPEIIGQESPAVKFV